MLHSKEIGMMGGEEEELSGSICLYPTLLSESRTDGLKMRERNRNVLPMGVHASLPGGSKQTDEGALATLTSGEKLT